MGIQSSWETLCLTISGKELFLCYNTSLGNLLQSVPTGEATWKSLGCWRVWSIHPAVRGPLFPERILDKDMGAGQCGLGKIIGLAHLEHRQCQSLHTRLLLSLWDPKQRWMVLYLESILIVFGLTARKIQTLGLVGTWEAPSSRRWQQRKCAKWGTLFYHLLFGTWQSWGIATIFSGWFSVRETDQYVLGPSAA